MGDVSHLVNQEETNLKCSHSIINKRNLQTSKSPSVPLFFSNDLISVTAVFLSNPLLCVSPLPLPASLSTGTRKRLVIPLQGRVRGQQGLPWLCFSLACP